MSDNIIDVLNALQNKYAAKASEPLPDWVNTHDYNSGAIVHDKLMAQVFVNELKDIIRFVRQSDVRDFPISY